MRYFFHLFLIVSLWGPLKSGRAEREEKGLREQAGLILEADRLRAGGKTHAQAIERALALERELFGDTTHALLFLARYQGSAYQELRSETAEHRAHAVAFALGLRLLENNEGKIEGAGFARRH